MDINQTALAVLIGLFLFASLVRIFSAPLRLALRLLLHTLLGFLALWLVQKTAGITGFSLGLNLWNALVIGCLGVPGLGLLLLVQWVL
ncbi:MAG: pro-sigmaK processing inhibitor BofA family protein [Oscillibacter sp.]|nr:pro-sigmaK processing inhibitor BofA family protein [Oscillibacter sp.]